jgi:4-diphosphocytidyl-2-C-methyl-D-erythritol kinase
VLVLDTVTAPAPAKINLILEVLGKRFDGYHELRTVLQTLELADTVTITARTPGGPGIIVTGPFAAGTPQDATNLAWRAAEELGRRTGHTPGGLAIHLEKRIPPAGGLGGGASDAATTLRLLQRVWEGVSDRHVAAAAAAVGSDEPFFMLGGTALATGRGDHVQAVEPLAPHAVVLFIPGATIEHKTGRMFHAIGASGFDDGSATAMFREAAPRRFRSSDVHNAFERVAFDVFTGLAEIHEEIQARIGEPVHLAGAGPTLFWIGPEEGGASVAERAQGANWQVIPTWTAPSLWKP